MELALQVLLVLLMLQLLLAQLAILAQTQLLLRLLLPLMLEVLLMLQHVVLLAPLHQLYVAQPPLTCRLCRTALKQKLDLELWTMDSLLVVM